MNAKTHTTLYYIVMWLAIIVLWISAYIGYLWMQSVDFSGTILDFVSTTQTKATQEQNNLQKINQQLDIYKNYVKNVTLSNWTKFEINIPKFDRALDVEKDNYIVNSKIWSWKIIWSERLASLVEVYEKIKSISDSNWNNTVALTDFVVEKKAVSLKGTVQNIRSIYQPEGVIERLQQLPFIKNIFIPSYQKVDENYEFKIQWDIENSK